MNENTKNAIEIIKDYICYIEEMRPFYGYSLKQISYAKTAALSIIKRMKKFKNISPLCIIESFRNDMYRYACLNEAIKDVFAIGIDVSEEIEDLLVGS